MKIGYVYIISNKNRTTLYIGVTNDISRRMLEHKSATGKITFASRYALCDLLYVEEIVGFQKAIDREKQLKNWHKEWKWNLIKSKNAELVDLASGWFSESVIEEFRYSITMPKRSQIILNDPETSSG